MLTDITRILRARAVIMGEKRPPWRMILSLDRRLIVVKALAVEFSVILAYGEAEYYTYPWTYVSQSSNGSELTHDTYVPSYRVGLGNAHIRHSSNRHHSHFQGD